MHAACCCMHGADQQALAPALYLLQVPMLCVTVSFAAGHAGRRALGQVDPVNQCPPRNFHWIPSSHCNSATGIPSDCAELLLRLAEQRLQ